MKDRRRTPANGRVAALHLKGRIAANRYVVGDDAQITAPVADLLSAPGGSRDRQLLMGTKVKVYERQGGWAFVQSSRDDYVGYLKEHSLGNPIVSTHRVSIPATHIYQSASFKSKDLMRLSFGAELLVEDAEKKMLKTRFGFVPETHLKPLDEPFNDPAAIAKTFLNTPYLWGGNSQLGIDCSGLVQVAYQGCNIQCPPDSDMQAEEFGHLLPTDATLHRGDLIFWKGHVAMMVTPTELIHANAHHMMVACETFEKARQRITQQGGGEIIAIRRYRPT